jgi:hypothetical protein
MEHFIAYNEIRMKHYLLFYRHKQSPRSKEFSFNMPLVCISGIYRCQSLTPAKEYVFLPTKTFIENLKNYLFFNTIQTGQIQLKNQSAQCDLCPLFLKGIGVDNQLLTIGMTIVSPLNFLTSHTCYVLSKRLPSSILKFFRQTIFLKQAHEHLYRLRSLIRHAAQSHLEQQTAGQGRDLF